jgi:epoxyqueuosine reductase
MGCMQCQRVCPEDKPFREWVEAGGEFGEDEAALLLSGPRREDLPAGVAEKLARLELLDDLTILSRNLGMLIGGP